MFHYYEISQSQIHLYSFDPIAWHQILDGWWRYTGKFNLTHPGGITNDISPVWCHHSLIPIKVVCRIASHRRCDFIQFRSHYFFVVIALNGTYTHSRMENRPNWSNRPVREINNFILRTYSVSADVEYFSRFVRHVCDLFFFLPL